MTATLISFLPSNYLFLSPNLSLIQGWDEKTNDWDGSTDWETLDDMWILDLSTRTWTRRYLFPSLERSYHSLVAWTAEPGWGKDFNNYTSWDGPVVSVFGGYTTGIDIFSGEVSSYLRFIDF